MPKTYSWTFWVDGEPFAVNITSMSNHRPEDVNRTQTAGHADQIYREVHAILGHGLECKQCKECPARSLDAMEKLNHRLLP